MVDEILIQSNYVNKGLVELIHPQIIARNDEKTFYSFLKGVRAVSVDDLKKKMKYSGYDED